MTFAVTFVRKTIQIAAIVLLTLLTALAAETVQIYRHARDQFNGDSADNRRDLNDIKAKDALGHASDALRNLQSYATDYVLTGRADSLKVCHESLEDWHYELGTLELLSGDESSAVPVRDFSKTGRELAQEMTAILSLYDTGSHDAALNRVRTGAAMAYRDKIDRMEESARKAFTRVRAARTYDSLAVPHRMLLYAGGLYLLGFAGLGMLLYLLRTTAGGHV